MATLTPKIQLKKPVPNVETDWAFRLNESLDTLDDAILTANLSGADGIEIFDDGNGNPTVSGNRSEILSVSGSLQGQIVSNDADIATNTSQIVSVSGHLQADIDSIDDNVTLQDAYDNGTGFVTTTSSKSVTISGAGGFVAVTGTFARSLRLPQFSSDPSTVINGDVWINTTTSGIRWQVNGTKFEEQGSELITKVYRYTGSGSSGKTVTFGGINRAYSMTFMRYSTTGNHSPIISMPDGETGTITRRNSSSGAGFTDCTLSAPGAGSSQVLTINNTLGTMNASAGIYRVTVYGTRALA